MPDSSTGAPHRNAPSATPSGSLLLSLRSLRARTSSVLYRRLRLPPSAASDRTIPRLTYEYSVGRLTPSSAAASPPPPPPPRTGPSPGSRTSTASAGSPPAPPPPPPPSDSAPRPSDLLQFARHASTLQHIDLWLNID